MARKYNVPLDGVVTVHVHDDGRVEVEAYLGGLGELIEQDPRVAYSDEEIQQDREQIERALMSSPANHYLKLEMVE